jgi:hypothetical protein
VDNVLKLQKRWSKMSRVPKWNYVIVNVALLRFALIMVLIILLTEVIIFNDLSGDFSNWLFTAIFKVILSIILGIYVGHLEWNFIRKLVNKDFERKKSIRQNFILIYGFLSFGLLIAIRFIELPFVFPLTIITFLLYSLSGLLFGYLMYFINEYGYNKYLKSSADDEITDLNKGE